MIAMADERISIEVFCQHEQVEFTFVHALYERGLIHVEEEPPLHYIAREHLPRLEQLARLHYDLEIDLAGLEAVSHLLERVERMQEEMRELRERLPLYEPE